MKDYTITIDCGTTNTRVLLFDGNQQLIHAEKRDIGVRNTAVDGHNGQLKHTIRNCIHKLLAAAGIGFADVKNIVATGMITSNMGLLEIPHLVVPVVYQNWLPLSKLYLLKISAHCLSVLFPVSKILTAVYIWTISKVWT